MQFQEIWLKYLKLLININILIKTINFDRFAGNSMYLS